MIENRENIPIKVDNNDYNNNFKKVIIYSALKF